MSISELLSEMPLLWLLLVVAALAFGLILRESLREAKALRPSRAADAEPQLGLPPGRPASIQALAEAQLSGADLNEQFSCFLPRRNPDQPLDATASTRLQAIPRRVGTKPVARVTSPGGDLLGLAVLLNARNSGLWTEADHRSFGELMAAMVDGHGDPLFYSPPPLESLRQASEAAGEMLLALDTRLVIHARVVEMTPAALGVAAAELHLQNIPERASQFLARDRQGLVQFALLSGPAERELILALDVPRVVDPEVALGRLFATGAALIEQFGGELHDEAGRALGERDIDAIRRGLLQRAEALTRAGLAPGSPSALWVFQ